jgi:hypothetical protein
VYGGIFFHLKMVYFNGNMKCKLYSFSKFYFVTKRCKNTLEIHGGFNGGYDEEKLAAYRNFSAIFLTNNKQPNPV